MASPNRFVRGQSICLLSLQKTVSLDGKTSRSSFMGCQPWSRCHCGKRRMDVFGGGWGVGLIWSRPLCFILGSSMREAWPQRFVFIGQCKQGGIRRVWRTGTSDPSSDRREFSFSSLPPSPPPPYPPSPCLTSTHRTSLREFELNPRLCHFAIQVSPLLPTGRKHSVSREWDHSATSLFCVLCVFLYILRTPQPSPHPALSPALALFCL